MKKLFNVSGLNQVYQKGISPFSTARRYADLANRWAMSNWGNRVASLNARRAMPAWALR